MICQYFHYAKNKLQNSYSFFLNLLINIYNIQKLISLIKIMRKFWCDNSKNNKYNLNRNLNSKNKNMFLLLQNFKNCNRATIFLCHYFQLALYSLSWKIAFKTKIVFSVIIMFADEKIEFWSILILSEWLLNVTWFLLKISLRVLMRALVKTSSLFILILQSEIVVTMLIKILIVLLNLNFFFFKL